MTREIDQLAKRFAELEAMLQGQGDKAKDPVVDARVANGFLKRLPTTEEVNGSEVRVRLETEADVLTLREQVEDFTDLLAGAVRTYKGETRLFLGSSKTRDLRVLDRFVVCVGRSADDILSADIRNQSNPVISTNRPDAAEVIRSMFRSQGVEPVITVDEKHPGAFSITYRNFGVLGLVYAEHWLNPVGAGNPNILDSAAFVAYPTTPREQPVGQPPA